MQIKNLSAFYGKKQVLNNVSFTLKPQCFTALIGKNGSGKSTLLECINGQVRYSGTILLKNRPIEDYTPKERAQKIAYLPQFLPASALTAEELIALGRNPYLGLSGKLQSKDREGIEEAIRLTETESLRHRLLAFGPCIFVEPIRGASREGVTPGPYISVAAAIVMVGFYLD